MAEWKKHLQAAIDHFRSQAALAAEMSRFGEKYGQTKISFWMTLADEIPPRGAIDIHLATDGFVPASDLRPDLWPTRRNANDAARAARQDAGAAA